MQRTSFCSARILLDTCYNPFIRGNVYLSIEGNGFDVYVKEIAKWCIDEDIDSEKVIEDDHSGGKQFPMIGDGVNQSERQKPVNHDVNQSLMTETVPILELSKVINYKNKTCRNMKNVSTEKVERSTNYKGSQTIGLEDDRRTEEVLRDLGLSQSSPNDNTLLAKAYREWSMCAADEEECKAQASGPSKPPGFEQFVLTQSQSETCSYVPNSFIHPPLVTEAPCDEQSENLTQFEDEATETWRTGLKVGLSTEHDGDTIQAIFEERKEWKQNKRNIAKKKKKVKAKGKKRWVIQVSPKSLDEFSLLECESNRW